ncbi:hypothetical protein G5630_14655 [Klebsiella quasipneumoniae]|uniref:hypothetical protein n=1 Tax=Klebsiella pneumoniae complex TaxID=3390273 RepID=UPI0013CFCEC6|nr:MULTISPECIES: hypothetical protein [Klebsiella]HBR1222433.1 hypothetical protein [Klebsiella quasipneumoniae subsp. similipneumoniae]MCJ8542296.1 hypothetical protein [Klebsiella variicola]MDK6227541.1 hypothetical protein [Klebsiella variicola]NGD59591.1 hypothetical protein [Klebsiella quasipneumoniae]HBQ5668737.1 hypothetical protein [Klebsiella quasipneumoniae]
MGGSTFNSTGNGDKSPEVTSSQVIINEDGDFTNKIVRQTKVEVIVISDDKLHIILTNCLGRISSLNQWATPLGILVTLAVTMLTTNFKAFILSASVWEAMFWIITILNVVWLIKSIPYRYIWIEVLHFFGKGEQMKSIRDVRHIIEKIKSGDTGTN